jgi:hypothetical protein
VKTAPQQSWPADQVERWPVDKLVPYARNSRTHSDTQVAQIAASIKEWGWTTPVLVSEDGTLIAGHGRVMAARKLGLPEVPVMIARGWTEAQRRAYVIADNKLALNAGWDEDFLKVELKDLGDAGFNLGLTGFSAEEMSDLFAGVDPNLIKDESLAENYSRKIEAPIYEITGKRPDISEMIDRSKTEALQEEIKSANLPDDVKGFLLYAAERHTVFNFRNVAEFYAHADAETQNLMERSALVIIDFDRAIEEGFVELSEELLALAGQDHE